MRLHRCKHSHDDKKAEAENKGSKLAFSNHFDKHF